MMQKNYDRKVTVIFEDNPNLFFYNQIFERYEGESLTCKVGVPKGYRIKQINYDSKNYNISARTGESESFYYYDITLLNIEYNTRISIELCRDFETLYFKDNELITKNIEDSPQINFNTLIYSQQFYKPEFIAEGFCTSDENNLQHIPFGGRIDRNQIESLNLFVEYIPETNSSFFEYSIIEGKIKITGFTKNLNTEILAVPSKINSMEVSTISSGAFKNQNFKKIVLSPQIKTIEENAFENCIIEELVFFDTITQIENSSFNNCIVKKIKINAAQLPVYEKTYFATFSDKMDYLIQNKNNKKIVIICGSSARFAYNSPLLENSFKDYKVINMGVYAYSNMMPLIYSILPYLKEGDIVISSPEFDSIDKQFCTSNAFDNETFCLYESNYSLLNELNMENFSNIFTAFKNFNLSRKNLSVSEYNVSPKNFDEDKNPVAGTSYNIMGDYIVYRENNLERKNFGVKRAFFNKEYFLPQTINSINHMYNLIETTGAKVYFAYSPRSSISISSDSTENSISELHQYLVQNLNVPVITKIQSCLFDPLYFYGTDNHLSTEGTLIYTQQIIDALKEVLEK